MKKPLIVGLLALIGAAFAVPVKAQIDVVVTKTAPSVVTAGQNLTYNLSVANIGLRRASQWRVTDALPPNTTFVSATQTSGPYLTINTPEVGATGTVYAFASLPGYATLREPHNFTVVGDTLFFVADDTNYGRKLWKTDGTLAGTVLVKDINLTSTLNGSPVNLTNVNGTLFFNTYHPNYGIELWKTDGTEAGTVLVKDINPGTNQSYPASLANLNGTLFFRADDGVNGSELWKSDGTPEGTVMVKDINPGGHSSPISMVNVGGTLFFVANEDGFYGSELWKSDGTAQGTVKLQPSGHLPLSLTDVNGTLFFDYNYGLWKSDGTPQGTVLVKNNFSGFSKGYPENLTPVGSTLYFRVSTSNGKELWKSDGTTAGTVFIKHILPFSYSFSTREIINVGSTLYLRAHDATHGAELWKSDGTTEGTTLVKDINPDNSSSYPHSNPSYLTDVNGTLFFNAYDGVNGQELWKSDGTPEGTVMVKDIKPGTDGSLPRNLFNWNGTLYFQADGGVYGPELWKSDGTPEGTVPLRGMTPNKATFEITVRVNNAATGTISNTANVTNSDTESDTSNNSATATTNVIALPRLNISDAPALNEGNDGTLDATFTVTLSEVSSQTVTVNAITYNGTAKAPGDYTSSGTTITFAPGETVKSLTVPVKGDTLDEPDEVFYVILSGAANAAIRNGRGVATIQDDDAPPSITIQDLSIKEYNAGQTTAAFRLNLSQPSGKAVTVTYATAIGTTNSATAGSDYVAVAPTQVTFNVGSSFAIGRVLINGDALNELNETFLVNLSSPLNATIADSQATGTILNDDSAPALTINDVSIAEGNSGTKQLTFTVTLSKASGQTISVNYATADGIARSASDYVSKSGTLTFAPNGALTQLINITINGDALVEGEEAFYIFLSGAVNANTSKGRGVGTIQNDDTSG
jgi:uncharacterized repeat protein (TIGR01451 family)